MSIEQTTEHRQFSQADEVRTFGHGHLELPHVGGSDIGRLVLSPGWRWSNDVKIEFDARPGDITSLPSGHDAWVIGDEDVRVVDWYGANEYAR